MARQRGKFTIENLSSLMVRWRKIFFRYTLRRDDDDGVTIFTRKKIYIILLRIGGCTFFHASSILYRFSIFIHHRHRHHSITTPLSAVGTLNISQCLWWCSVRHKCEPISPPPLCRMWVPHIPSNHVWHRSSWRSNNLPTLIPTIRALYNELMDRK